MFGAELVAGLPRVQGDLGSATEDEPGQGRRSVPDRREPAPRRRLPPAASSRRTSSIPDDDGSFVARDAALRRRRQVPPRDDGGVMCPSYMVTREEKHSTRGRARLLFEMLHGEVHRATAGRARRCRRRSTCASPARAARATARSTSTWRPTRPSSCRTTTRGRLRPARRLRDGPDLLVGAARLEGAAARQLRRAARRGFSRDRQGALAASPRPRSMPALRAPDLPRLVRARRAAPAPRAGRAGVMPLARHLQQPLPSRDRHRRGGGARGRRLRRVGSRRRRSAAAGRSTTTACSTWRQRLLRRSLDDAAAGDRARHARSSGSSRAASPSSATSCQPVPARRGRAAARATRPSPERVPRPARAGLRAAAARRRQALVHGHCHHKPVLRLGRRGGAAATSSGSTCDVLDSGCCGMAGSFGFEAATTTTSRWRAASACCCRPCARPARRR